MPIISFAVTGVIIIWLWTTLENSIFAEKNERKKAHAEMNKVLESIGDDLNLLTIKHRKLAIHQSRNIHLHLHEQEKIKVKLAKGAGRHALIPNNRHGNA